MLHNTFPTRSNSAPKPLTATLMQEIITMHEKFLKQRVPASGAWRSAHIWEKQFALKYSNGKAMPSGFSHFYCHRVVLSTQKFFEGFFQYQRAARWSPTAKNIVSYPLIQPQRPDQNPDH